MGCKSYMGCMDGRNGRARKQERPATASRAHLLTHSPTHPLTHSPARGFNLIEVLLAVTVFAIVLAAINTVFYSALRLRARTSAALDESAPVEQTLNVMRRDLQAAVGPGGVLAGDFKSGSVSSGLGLGQASAIEFYTAPGGLRGDPARGDIP